MQKKKILHLITGLEIGGTEMMLLKTLPRMQNDFDNRVCCIHGHGPIGKQLEERGVPVYYLDLRHPLDIKIIPRFKKIVQEFKPDILITYLIHADLFGRIFGKLFGVKKIICNQRGKLLQWEFLRIFDRVTKSLVTKYIVQTEVAKQELMKKLQLSAEKFEIIPNAIDIEEFNFEINKDKKREELGLIPTNIVITCVSKLRRGKGHRYLLEAFEQLSDKNFHLLIVGDGEQKQELLKKISNYSSKENVHFLGNRNDVKEILKISDVFILPTLGEGMSNAIMEAMAASLPVITTDIPENRILIEHEKNGILIPKENTSEIVTAIEGILAHTDKAHSIGKSAQEKINKLFSIQRHTTDFAEFLSKN